MRMNDLIPFADLWRKDLYGLIADLTQEELDRKQGTNGKTIGGLLRHMVNSERWLIRHVVKKELVKSLDPERCPAMPEIRFALQEVRKETETFLENLTDQDLEQTYPWPNKTGWQPPMNPVTLRWLLYHIEEHVLHHKGQVSLLKQRGRNGA